MAHKREPGDVADLGEQDQDGERAGAGQRGEDLDPRVGPGVLADLKVEPVRGPCPVADGGAVPEMDLRLRRQLHAAYSPGWRQMLGKRR